MHVYIQTWIDTRMLTPGVSGSVKNKKWFNFNLKHILPACLPVLLIKVFSVCIKAQRNMACNLLYFCIQMLHVYRATLPKRNYGNHTIYFISHVCVCFDCITLLKDFHLHVLYKLFWGCVCQLLQCGMEVNDCCCCWWVVMWEPSHVLWPFRAL